MKNVTIKDIAGHLQLSVSTVSRALAGDSGIRGETRERVVRAAAEMGYRRNSAAAMLRTGRTNTIGVIVNEMMTPFSPKVLEGIQDVLQQEGYRLQLADSRDDPDQEHRNIALMEESRVDGIIVAPCHSLANLSEFRRLQLRGYPIVFYARTLRDFNVSRVVANDYDKAYFLTEHLIRSGRRRIVHVSGPEEVSNFTDIRKGYIECLRKFNIPVDKSLVIPADLTVKSGQKVADRLLAGGVDFDSIFACSDILAIAIMNRLRRHGYRIPEDVAVAGFSGSPLSQLVYPSLTTVEPPLFEMGQRTARLLLDRIRTPESTPETIVLDAKICLRESSLT